MGLKNIVDNLVYGNRILSVFRIILGALFLCSGFFKALDPVKFGKVMELYQIIPAVLVPYGAIVIPYLELVLGACRISGYRTRAASLITLFMMLAFSIFISVNLVRGRNFECGCFELGRFGVAENISPWLVARDLVMALFLYLICRARRHFYSLENYLEKWRLRRL